MPRTTQTKTFVYLCHVVAYSGMEANTAHYPGHHIKLGGMVSLGTDHTSSHIHSKREERYSTTNVEVKEPLGNRTRPIYPVGTKSVRIAVCGLFYDGQDLGPYYRATDE
jgi:hypothetical protein